MGRSVVDLTSSADLVEQAEEIMGELRQGRSWTGEFAVRRKDGTSFPTLVTVTPMQDEQGNLVAIIGVSTDITEIKQTEELSRSVELFGLLDEVVKEYAIFMLDPEGCISNWSAGAERMKGYRAGEIVGRHFSVLYPPEDIERGHPEGELRIAKERGHYEEEGFRVRKDGSRFCASVLITALHDEEGNLRGFSKVVRDVSERKAAEEALRDSEARNRAILDTAPDAILTMTPDGIVRSFNRGAEKMFGPAAEEVVGRPLWTLMPERFREPHERGFRRYLTTGEARVVGKGPVRVVGLRKGGEEFPVELSVGEVSEGRERLFTGIVRDISEREAVEKRLEHLAFHDSLTGLPNRSLLSDRFDQAAGRADRAGKYLAILYLDLDGFKRVNDTLGHETGDRLLVAVAERLGAHSRLGDTVARIGGDEFCVLAEDVGGGEEAARVAGRVRRALREPFPVEGRRIFVGASIGAAVRAPGEDAPLDRLLREADAAMYRAKKSGEAPDVPAG
ncbi:MAG: PAS domain S-box protein [Actinomycetota bacterium]|nr:PAS domain S-box protein [Actinomycetota bacterium]